MTGFDKQAILDDLREFQAMLAAFWEGVLDDVWKLRTGGRDKDWTLHEVLAHLVSIARLFNLAAEAAIQQTPPTPIDGLAKRTDLGEWNLQQIAELSQNAPQVLIEWLLDEFNATAMLAGGLTPEQAEQTVFLPPYGRSGRAIDCIDWQLSHAGVIHAAQITRPLAQSPLWEAYSPGLLHRQVDRFIRHFSVAYWPEYGDGQETVMNFHIGGESGGVWHVIAAPDGGHCGAGGVEHAPINLHFDSPATLFGVFTVQINMGDALSSGRMRVEGDAARALKLMRLFTPSPPRVS